MTASRPETPVRTAAPADRGHIVSALSAAFQDDPIMCFIYPDPRTRRTKLPLLFEAIYSSDVACGRCLTLANGEAATLWRAPGLAYASWREKLVSAVPLMRALGPALGRGLAFGAASDANHPAGPHWYLHIAGCAPAQQGRGFGRMLVRAGLDRADRDGLPAYLETATERNVGYYQSFGFTVTHRWRVRRTLDCWSMLRPPA